MPDQTPAPLTDDELREIAANGWAPQGARLATEMLAARAEIDALRNDLDAKASDFDAACRHLGEARARITQLEVWKANAEVTLAEDARYIHEANSGELVRRLGDERDALRARITELEDQVAFLADAEMERARLSLYARNARRTITTMWQSRRHWQNRAAELNAERDSARRGAKTLGGIVERQCQHALDATGLHHLIDEDGDGDWGAVWERLAEMGAELNGLREVAEQRLEVIREQQGYAARLTAALTEANDARAGALERIRELAARIAELEAQTNA